MKTLKALCACDSAARGGGARSGAPRAGGTALAVCEHPHTTMVFTFGAKSTVAAMDAELLEQHKENIRPLAEGHAAGKLRQTLGLRPAPGDAAAFEATLANLDELDDPLQAFCDYVEWTHTAFPQGSNRASGLVLLLERCTSQFRDTPHYKNDPRYVRLWMEYKDYLDAPRDVFVYLAKKGIGLQLAMYYEQFGDFLEAQGDVAAAREVYERGVAVQARPAKRMARSRESFERRAAGRSPRRERRGLGAAGGANDGGSASGAAGGAGAFAAAPAPKRPKLTVYTDDAAPASVFDAAPASLASIKLRTKENTLAAQPWAGEVIPQRPVERTAGTRIEVYRDPASGPASAGLCSGQPACQPAGPGVVFSITVSHGVAHTLVETAKKPERLAFNLGELYTPTEEFCLGEVMARRRRGNRRRSDRLELVLDDTTRPASPTMTMFSRMANNEVLDMFNRAEPHDSAPETTETETNYDGFVTETLTKAEWGEELPAAGTPPTDHYDSASERASSPFVERPLVRDADPAGPFDPMDLELRERLLTRAGAASLPGAHRISLPKRNLARFAAITNPHTQVIPKGCAESIIDYCGPRLSLRFKLGRGGYGTVYLVETEQGQLRALKIETPASRWEYYVLSQIHARVPAQARAMFVQPRLLHCFEDESYFLMDYVSQGTVLDVLNYYKRTGKDSVDEAVAMWIALKVLCSVEAMHAAGVIHADLKADNCMMRFGADSGVTLIDFGRAVDLRLLKSVASAAPPAAPAAPTEPRFVSHWRCDLQDCPQMHRGESWSHEADFYGAAAVVHTMLFGRYIEVTERGGRYVLRASFKRYWQTQIWGPFFDAMLNGEGGVRHHRQVMEEWLASSARGLEGKLRDVEVELRENAKRVLRSL